MQSEKIRGLVFLSHWSGDAHIVSKLRDRLHRSQSFVDLDSIDPGTYSLDAMKHAVAEAAVFVFIISPQTPPECFSFYEAACAEYEKARNPKLQLLVWPIDGATFHDCPEWLRKYFAVPEEYTINDVAREVRRLTIKYLQHSNLIHEEVYEGRESLERKIAIEMNSQEARENQTVNTLVLSGIPGIGRTSLARNLMRRMYPALRSCTPEFDLQDSGGAVDLYLHLMADLEGGISTERIRTLQEDFPAAPEEQAKVISACLDHWGKLNQPVIIRIRWALRNQSGELAPWFRFLSVELSKANHAGVVVFVSGRKLAPESLAPLKNVMNFDVPELDKDTISYVLTKLIQKDISNPALIRRLAELSAGHPDTARHISFLVVRGRTADTVLRNPEQIHSFQDRALEEIYNSEALSDLHSNILSVLCWFPGIDTFILDQVFPDIDSDSLTACLWELVDYCLIEQTQIGTYHLPALVRGTVARRTPILDRDLQERITDVLQDVLEDQDVSPDQLEPIVLSFTMSEKDLPQFLREAITPGTLARVVERHYERGRSSNNRADLERNFRTAAKLAEFALTQDAERDTLENILFLGADALTRMGTDPGQLLDRMTSLGMPSANYVRASYKFHVLRDGQGAISDLKVALASKKFKRRSIRLLTRVHLRMGNPSKALDTLDNLSSHEIERDSGFLAMKFRALRALKRYSEADEIAERLRSLGDEFGDVLMFEATKSLKERDFEKAASYVEQAMAKPKANVAPLMFLKCVIHLNNGDASLLPEACALAERMGRHDDAHQLRARSAILVDKNWRAAESELNKVQYTTWFDWELRLQILNMKEQDDEVRRDVTALNATKEQKEEALRRTRSSFERLD